MRSGVVHSRVSRWICTESTDAICGLRVSNEPLFTNTPLYTHITALASPKDPAAVLQWPTLPFTLPIDRMGPDLSDLYASTRALYSIGSPTIVPVP